MDGLVCNTAIYNAMQLISIVSRLSEDTHSGKKAATNLVYLDVRDSAFAPHFISFSHSLRNVHFTHSIADSLSMISGAVCAAVFIGDGFLQNLNRDSVDQIRAVSSTPDLSIVLLADNEYNEEQLLQYYDLGFDDIIFSYHQPLILKTKISLFETLFQQRNELRQMNIKLQAVNKQLEEYVYIVSHDLKAPLRGLSSLSQFIEDELGTEATTEAKDLLAMMKSRTDRMQQMIDGILHYSRMSNYVGEKEEVNVNYLINNIIDLISPPENVRIEYPDQLPVLETERIKIHEVLQNLLLNSIKHNDKSDIRIKISVRDLGEWFEFSVIDNGKGIKLEHQERVFGLFQTLMPKDRSEGTGLGLTIVKKLVEQQSGKVTVKSEFGKGSTFSFTWKK